MTAFGAIQAALSYLKVPCVPGTYEGSEQTYITYNYALIRGADFGDNAPASQTFSARSPPAPRSAWLPAIPEARPVP